jgi:hypothetical protein
MENIKSHGTAITLLSVIICLLMPGIANAITLDVNLTSGTSQKFDIATIRKITYAMNAPVSMIITFNDATTNSFDISTIRSITFGGKPAKSDFTMLKRLKSQLALFTTRKNGTVASVQFSLDKPSNVVVTLHRLDGRMIRMVTNYRFDAGDHVVFWDGTNASGAKVAAGSYILKINGVGASQAFKFVTVR